MRNLRLYICLFLFCSLWALPINAQTFSNHIQLGVGVSYERGLEGNLAIEHETQYHNAWEYYINYFLKYEKETGTTKNPDTGETYSYDHYTHSSFWRSYNTWELGVAYKPCVVRGKNYHGNLRFGAGLGSSIAKDGDQALFDEFVGSLHVGYEQNYVLRHGWILYFQPKADCTINGKDLIHVGIDFGVKIPTSKR